MSRSEPLVDGSTLTESKVYLLAVSVSVVWALVYGKLVEGLNVQSPVWLLFLPGIALAGIGVTALFSPRWRPLGKVVLASAAVASVVVYGILFIWVLGFLSQGS